VYAVRPLHPERLQSLLRDVNERIAEDVYGRSLRPFLCECADPRCTEQLELTRREYEAIRKLPTRFVTLPGHEHEEDERVLLREARFQVVEKLGDARVDAIQFDPRRRNPVPTLRPAG
jgi:hypothetical protein